VAQKQRGLIPVDVLYSQACAVPFVALGDHASDRAKPMDAAIATGQTLIPQTMILG